MLVDADTQAKAPAFDHAKLADALSTALGRKVTGTELPFNDFTFTPDLRRIEFQLAPRPGAAPAPAGPPAPPWRCSLDSYSCAQESRAAGRGGRGGRGGGGLSGPVRAEFDVNGAEPQAIARRQVRGDDPQLQRRHPRERRPRGHAPQHRRLRRRLLRSRLARLVAGFDQARRLQGHARPPPLRALRRVVTGGSAAAETLDAAVCQAWRRARRRAPVHLSRRLAQADRRRQRALRQRLRHDPPRMAPRQFGRHLRVQPARPSALSRHLDRSGIGCGAGPDHRGVEDVLLLLRQEVPPGSRRRQGNHLDVGTGRLESPLPVRRRHGRGEAADHQG